jgi:hypothetical protein
MYLLDPVSEYRDAGQAFYATDFWSLWDIGTISIGLAFFITSELQFHGRYSAEKKQSSSDSKLTVRRCS